MAGYEGQQFGDYRLIRQIGAGISTEVHLCEHLQQKSIAAIKIPRVGPFLGVDRKEFLTDARKISRVKHPHIIQFLDFGVNRFQYSELPFLVMDYAPNGSLRQRHPKGSRLMLETIIDYTSQITDALTYLHSQKLYHQHIKPENILIGIDSKILLGDFGIDWEDYIDNERLAIDGESNYLYPEYFNFMKSDGRYTNDQNIDQYVLATLIYEWLCGDIPFEGRADEVLFKILNNPPQPLREKVPGISPAIEAVVMKALAKQPEQRFESVGAFAKALEEAAFPPKVNLSSPDFAGRQLGNYRLTRKLGSGGFADVYLGQHRRLNTFAAIKVLHSRMSNNDVKEFEKEAQTIANLRHPSIVRVLDFVVEGNTPFLVMDYAVNGTLRQRHPEGSRLPLNSVVYYVKQMAGALQFAHDQKLIHRDVKPENMLLGPNNEILLSDFGIAAVAHSTRSLQTQGMAGTIYYMAPEQIQGKARPASDQYALAAVAYEWLSGSRPFNGTPWEIVTQHLTAPLPPLREKNPAISPAVEHVLQIALAKDPHQRFASVQAFANALEQASK